MDWIWLIWPAELEKIYIERHESLSSYIPSIFSPFGFIDTYSSSTLLLFRPTCFHHIPVSNIFFISSGSRDHSLRLLLLRPLRNTLWPHQSKGLSTSHQNFAVTLEHCCLLSTELLRCRDSCAGQDRIRRPGLIFCSSWYENDMKMTSKGSRNTRACTLSAASFVYRRLSTSLLRSPFIKWPFPWDQKESSSEVVARPAERRLAFRRAA